MDNRLLREVRRKVAVIVTFVLISSVVLNNLITVKASGEKIYVDKIQIMDEENVSVSEGNMIIDQETLSITRKGGINTEGLSSEGQDSSKRWFIEAGDRNYSIQAPGYEEKSGLLENTDPEEFILKKKFAVDVTVSSGDSEGGISVSGADLYIRKAADTGDGTVSQGYRKTDENGKTIVLAAGIGNYEMWAEWQGMKTDIISLQMENASAYPSVSDSDSQELASFHLTSSTHLDFHACKVVVEDNSEEGEDPIYAIGVVEKTGESESVSERSGNYDIKPGSTVRLTITPPDGCFVKKVTMKQSDSQADLIPRRAEDGSDKVICEFEAGESCVIHVEFGEKDIKNSFKILISNKNVLLNDNPTKVIADTENSYKVSLNSTSEDKYKILNWSVSKNNAGQGDKKDLIQVSPDEKGNYCLEISPHAFLAEDGIYTIECKVAYYWGEGDSADQIANEQIIKRTIKAVEPEVEYGRDFYLRDLEGIKIENAPETGVFYRVQDIVIPKSSILEKHYFDSYNLYSKEQEGNPILVSGGDLFYDDDINVIANQLPDGRYSLELIMNQHNENQDKKYDDYKVSAMDFMVDNTSPDQTVYILYEGDNGRTEDSTVQNPESEADSNRYQFGSTVNSIYNREYVDLTIFARDLPGDPLTDAVSGIETIKVSYWYNTGDTSDTEGSQVQEKEFTRADDGFCSSKAEIDGEIYDCIKLHLPVSEGDQAFSYITSIEITDAAGNSSKASYLDQEIGEEITKDRVTYILDSVSPVLSVTMPKAICYDKDKKIYYYNKLSEEENRIFVQIKEKNFFIDDVELNLKPEGFEKELTSKGFEETDNSDLHQNILSIPDGDGCYQFSVSCSDRSGNVMKGDGALPEGASLEGGNYVSPVLIMDQTAPVIKSISWKYKKENPQKLPEDGFMVTKEEFYLRVCVSEENVDKIVLIKDTANEDGSFDEYEFTEEPESNSDGTLTYFLEIKEDMFKKPEGSDSINQVVKIKVTDKSGNKIISDGFRIIIDNTSPKVDKIIKNPESEWYSQKLNENTPLTISFDVQNYAKLSSVVLQAVDDEKIKYNIDFEEGTRGDTGVITYNICTKQDLFRDAKDQSLQYRLIVADEFGKTNTDCVVNIGIDNTSPDHLAFVKADTEKIVSYYGYDHDEKKLIKKEIRDLPIPYDYGVVSGVIYTDNGMDIYVYVRDDIGKDSINNAMSGLQSAKLIYHYTKYSNQTTMTEKETISFEGVSDSDVVEGEIVKQGVAIAEKEDSFKDYNCLKFTIPAREEQNILRIDSIILIDKAGNTTSVSSGDSENDKMIYVIDNIAPVFDIEIPQSTGEYHDDENTIYYNKDLKDIPIYITENNFYNEDISIEYMEESEDKEIFISDFIYQDQEGQADQDKNKYKAVWNLKDKDGIGVYRFSISYTDRSGNKMVGSQREDAGDTSATVVTEGKYTSPIMIVDKKVPVIESFQWVKADGSEQEFVNHIALTNKELELQVKIKEDYVANVNLMDGKEIIGKFSNHDQQDSSLYTIHIDETTLSGGEKSTNKVVYVQVIDKAGNITNSEKVRIIIDKDGPVLVDNIVKSPVKNWYSNAVNAGTPLQFQFGIQDYAQLKSVRMEAVEDSTIGHPVSLTLLEGTLDAATGYMSYQFTTEEELFRDDLDQKLDYHLVLEDIFGNSSTVGLVNVGIDNTRPDEKVYINFRGDKDKFYDKSGLLAEPDNDYQYGSQTGTLYNKDKVTLSVFVQDLASDTAILSVSSGLIKVKVTYQYTETTNKAEKDKTAVLEFEEGRDTAVINRKKATINGRIYDEVVFTFDVQKGQKIAGITSIEMTDAAGNDNRAAYENITLDQVDYVVDNTAPVLTVGIPAGSSGYDKDSNVYYYNAPVENIEASVAENNFFAEDVKANLKTGEADKNVSMGGFLFHGENIYRSSFALKEGDGIYRFSLDYKDRSENAMIKREGGPEDVTNGLYHSPVLVVDTTAPVMDIRYYRGGADVTGNIYGGNCFDGDITAVISVREVNFDPGLVTVKFSAEAAGNNAGFGHTYRTDGWSRSGDTYTYTINCTEEASYHISAECRDKAGNVSNSVNTSNFTVDKTAPNVAIAYDQTIDSTYYKTSRTATVTVVDQNFNPDAADYVVTTTGPQPSISNWSHAAGNGCGGSNHVKGCTWSSQVSFDQDADYTFAFNCSDKAGNHTASSQGEKFTIDKTNPAIVVAYDNNNAQNSNYFKEARQATITVTEHNFDEVGAVITVETPDGSVNSHTGWRNTAADTYVSTIRYEEDGEYTFHISFVDQAGNEASPYPGDSFIIDKTAPVLELKGVNPYSANKGTVMPEITYIDKNFDAEAVNIRITGVNNGEIKLESERTTRTDGQDIQFSDFSHERGMDDMYTLTASVQDKAGNVTEDSLLFSVNRFGSVYVLGEDVKKALGQFYINYGPELTVTEINVDTLEFQDIAYSLDGNIVTLEQDKDYTVEESGAEYEWKEYTYHISDENFQQEGLYVVTIQSKDRAENSTNNRLKEKEIEFVVDKTKPTIVVGGIEDNARYQEESRTVTIDAADNIYLTSIEVYVNDNLAATYNEDMLEAGGGIVTVDIKGAQKWQTMYVKARDAAGNETTLSPVRFLITANLFIQWFNNRPLFAGSIAGVCLLGGGTFFGVYFRRKRKMISK